MQLLTAPDLPTYPHAVSGNVVLTALEMSCSEAEKSVYFYHLHSVTSTQPRHVFHALDDGRGQFIAASLCLSGRRVSRFQQMPK